MLVYCMIWYCFCSRFEACVVLVLSVRCAPFIVALNEFYHWNFMAIHYFLNFTLCFLQLSSSGSANAQLSGCFSPRPFSLNNGLNRFLLDSFKTCLQSLLGYSTREFQLCNWLFLRRLVPGINHLPPVCWSTFGKLFVFLLLHILMPCNMIVLHFRLHYFHVSNGVFFYTVLQYSHFI